MSADKNYEFFKRELPNIISTHRGQFVVIRNEQIIDFYANAELALRDSYQRFQDNDFIVQEVTDEDRVNYINTVFLQT